MSYAQDRIQKSGGAYADGDSYADRSKVGAYIGAGLVHARAELSVFEAELNGPSMSVGAQVSLSHGVSAMVGAEVASVLVGAGPVKVKAGLGFNTGGSVGPDGLELQVLGTGVRLGPNPKVSVLGSSVECSVV